MRCRKCGATAAINMPQHRLSLCASHFSDWFIEQTERTIHKYKLARPDDRLLVAVSGGKDSLALWDVLHKIGYQADGLYIDLGIDGSIAYSNRSHQLTEQFASERGLRLHVFNVAAEFGLTIPQMLERSKRGSDRACSLCGLIKRRVFNTFTRQGGYTALATGHNLDDEAAVLFSNNLSWTVDQMQRQAPMLPANEHFAAKIKPFFRFYERETAAYTLINGIEYIEEECPFAVGSNTNFYKTILNGLERERPGSKLFYLTRFIQQKENLFPPAPASAEPDRRTCPRCGELTTTDGLCALCKVLVEVQS